MEFWTIWNIVKNSFDNSIDINILNNKLEKLENELARTKEKLENVNKKYTLINNNNILDTIYNIDWKYITYKYIKKIKKNIEYKIITIKNSIINLKDLKWDIEYWNNQIINNITPTFLNNFRILQDPKNNISFSTINHTKEKTFKIDWEKFKISWYIQLITKNNNKPINIVILDWKIYKINLEKDTLQKTDKIKFNDWDWNHLDFTMEWNWKNNSDWKETEEEKNEIIKKTETDMNISPNKIDIQNNDNLINDKIIKIKYNNDEDLLKEIKLTLKLSDQNLKEQSIKNLIISAYYLLTDYELLKKINNITDWVYLEEIIQIALTDNILYKNKDKDNYLKKLLLENKDKININKVLDISNSLNIDWYDSWISSSNFQYNHLVKIFSEEIQEEIRDYQIQNNLN